MDRGRAWWGLVLVALGGVLLADRLGSLAAGAVVSRWWPLAVVAAGLLQLVGRPRDLSGAVVTTGIGTGLLAWRLDVVDGDLLALVIPAGLVVAGVVLLVRRPGARPTAAVDEMDVMAVLGGREVRVTSSRFQGGRVTAVLGGAEIDLRDAVLPASGAEVEVLAVLGGVEVTLPSGWQVHVSGPAVLGGVEDRTAAAPADAPVLTIRACVVLGGLEVTTDPAVQARRPVPPVAPAQP